MKVNNIFVKFITTSTLILGLSFFNITGYAADVHDAPQVVNDAVITTTIKMKYAKDPLVSAFDIHVKTNHGVAKLSGLVDTNTQYERAIILAENTQGVNNINATNLKVKSSDQPLADTAITAKIKGLLIKNQIINDENNANPWLIHVETKNGVVFISGKAENQHQIEQIIKTAKLVDGVKSVKSNLKLK